MKTFSIILAAIFMSGCSVYQATSGDKAPDARNFSVLEKGTHRHAVLAEFGKPLVTDIDGQDKVDIFKFKQGQHGAFKAAKALGYSIAAVYTLGLSEVILFPLESAAGAGAEMQISVVYNEHDVVSEVRVLNDGRWLPIQRITQESEVNP